MNEPVSVSFVPSIQWPIEYPFSGHHVFDGILTTCDAFPAKACFISAPTAEMVLDCLQDHPQPTPSEPSICKQALQLLCEFCVIWPVATRTLLRCKMFFNDVTRAFSV